MKRMGQPNTYRKTNSMLMAAALVMIGVYIAPSLVPADSQAGLSKQLSLSKPRLISEADMTITAVYEGQMVGVETKITNNIANRATFTFIVQIKDEDGVTVFLTWIKNLSVLPNDSVRPVTFWLTDGLGKYQIEVFAWQSIDNPVPLATSKTLTFFVEKPPPGASDFPGPEGTYCGGKCK